MRVTLAAVTGVALASAPTVSAPVPVSTLPVTVLGTTSSVISALSALAVGVLSKICTTKLVEALERPAKSVTVMAMESELSVAPVWV